MRQHGLEECADWVFSHWYHEVPTDLPQRTFDLGATAVVCMNDGFAIELMQAAQRTMCPFPAICPS
jgi:DNA-binding LacI/PurR family transcriptional regulator